MSAITPTEKTTLKRLPKRGEFDRNVINAILDEGFICHVGFVVDGQPYVIPTGYGRIEENLYLHGSAASRMLRSLQNGVELCVTVTLVDGLVLARSVFHHSMNYRSVVILGQAREVIEPPEKLSALEAITENIVAGRWNEARLPNDQEMKATMVLCLPIEEVSAKIRTGPPLDDEEDFNLPVWAGVIPLRLVADAPIADSLVAPEAGAPDSAVRYKRPGW